MLIVGTKGRSLDGVQGFLVNRSSFSKYCLQYSPIPVVVVRPTEKREKKRLKRAGDPTRQNYLNLLGGQKHEADSETSSLYNLEPNITADEEAHKVAVAVGLPAAYDPTIKRLPHERVLGPSLRNRSVGELPKEAPQIVAKGGVPVEKTPGEDTDSEEEEEFEVESGEQLLRKEQLKSMEHNEGAALRRQMSSGSTDSDDEVLGSGGAKTT